MDQLWKKVIGINLKSAREKFAATKSWWWHLSHKPAYIERQYRQFLYLTASNPEKTVIAWSKDVEEFWRQHALNAEKYAADCNAIVGQPIRPAPKNRQRVKSSCARGDSQTVSGIVWSIGKGAQEEQRASGLL